MNYRYRVKLYKLKYQNVGKVQAPGIFSCSTHFHTVTTMKMYKIER